MAAALSHGGRQALSAEIQARDFIIASIVDQVGNVLSAQTLPANGPVFTRPFFLSVCTACVMKGKSWRYKL